MKTKIKIKISDSLIISRLQQKELLEVKSSIHLNSEYFPLVTKATLAPFFDRLPKNIALDIKLLGDKIINANAIRGYFSHHLEEVLKDLSPYDAVMAIARLNFQAPIFYQLALMNAFEQLEGKSLETKESQQRCVALEFARIAHHVLVLKNMLLCLQHNSLAHLVETIHHILELPIAITSRVYDSNEKPNETLSYETIHQGLSDGLILVQEIKSALNQEEELLNAMAKKATIRVFAAASLGLTGIFLRANRSFYDLRHEPSPHNLYQTAPDLMVHDGGDMWARFNLRLLEIAASLRFLKHILESDGISAIAPIVVDAQFGTQEKPHSFAFAEIEGPEGDIKISIFKRESSSVFRIRTPAYFIAHALPYFLIDANLSDIPLTLYSLGITPEEIDK